MKMATAPLMTRPVGAQTIPPLDVNGLSDTKLDFGVTYWVAKGHTLLESPEVKSRELRVCMSRILDSLLDAYNREVLRK